jgi:proteasome accessory factor C
MSRQLTAGERLERMLAIVPWVAGQPAGASIPEVCARFDLDRVQLLSCLERVFMVGVYPYTPDALIDVVIDADHVQITMPDFFRRPLRLTSEQRLALLVARRTFQSMPGHDAKGPLTRGLEKIAVAIGAGESGAVDIDIATAPEDTITRLRAAVAELRTVQFDYYSYGRDVQAHRTVDPWRVQMDAGKWYLEGRCHDASEPRLFRVDRISGVDVTGRTFDDPGALPPLDVFPRDGIDQFIVLDLEPDAQWVITHYPVASVEQLDGGRARVRLAIATRPWLERLLLRLGASATIIDASPGLDDVGPQAARRMLNRYRG